jgi:hypothetical protein
LAEILDYSFIIGQETPHGPSPRPAQGSCQSPIPAQGEVMPLFPGKTRVRSLLDPFVLSTAALHACSTATLSHRGGEGLIKVALLTGNKASEAPMDISTPIGPFL